MIIIQELNARRYAYVSWDIFSLSRVAGLLRTECDVQYARHSYNVIAIDLSSTKIIVVIVELFTDLGSLCKLTTNLFSSCSAQFLRRLGCACNIIHVMNVQFVMTL